MEKIESFNEIIDLLKRGYEEAWLAIYRDEPHAIFKKGNATFYVVVYKGRVLARKWQWNQGGEEMKNDLFGQEDKCDVNVARAALARGMEIYI